MDTSKPTEPSTDPRVTVPPRAPICTVSRMQIEGLEMPLYRVETSAGAKTEFKPARVMRLVAAALGLAPRTRAAKTPAAAKAKK